MSMLLKSYGIQYISRHGELLYDTNGDPSAVIIGSHASGGKAPWNIHGRRVWIAVGISKSRSKIMWGPIGLDIPTITNSNVRANQLNDSSGTGPGNSVILSTTELQMDNAVVDTYTSDELTTKILEYGTANSVGFPAAEYCDSIVLKDGTHMDLPSIHVLMRIFQSVDMLKEILVEVGLSSEVTTISKWWEEGEYDYAWSSSEGHHNVAFCIWRSTIHVSEWAGAVTTTYKNNSSNEFVIPVLEIPAY